MQALIKEKFASVNATLQALHETQRTWTVPDSGLKASLKERIYANFLPHYQVRASLLGMCCLCFIGRYSLLQSMPPCRPHIRHHTAHLDSA